MTSQPSTPSDTPCPGGMPAALVQMRAQVRSLTDTLFAARSGAELMDTVAEIESLTSTLEALELHVVRELEATNAVKPVGWASTQDFVTAVAGGYKGYGSAVIRLAKAVEAPLLAPVGESLADGWLSTAKAQVIVRAVDELPGDVDLRQQAVAVLLDEAKRLDASDLRRAGRHLIEKVDPDGQARRDEKALDQEERGAHLGRGLSFKDDGAGGVWIRGRCSSEYAATIRSALFPLAAPHPTQGPVCDPDTCQVPGCGHDGRDPRDHGARLMDALHELCGQALASGHLPTCHGAFPRVTVTIDVEDLKHGSGYGTTETGEDLSAETVRRMACDAEIIPVVLGTQGQVLDVGRASRLVTAVIWMALVTRDRHCRFPNCTRLPLMCHAHHIVHWADGGPTNLANLILLCGHHHRLIHSGPWTIRRIGPNSYAFDPPAGIRRVSSPGREPPD